MLKITTICTKRDEKAHSFNVRVQFNDHVIHRTVLATATPPEVANALQSIAYELRKLACNGSK